MRRLLFVFVALWSAAVAVSSERLRVACVGNSVTYGMTLADREHTAYPHSCKSCWAQTMRCAISATTVPHCFGGAIGLTWSCPSSVRPLTTRPTSS